MPSPGWNRVNGSTKYWGASGPPGPPGSGITALLFYCLTIDYEDSETKII